MSYSNKFNTVFALVTEAKYLGMAEKDQQDCNNLLEHGEFGLAIDHMATQLYEHDIPITEDFFRKLAVIAQEMKMDESTYTYISTLIK
jgi:hypothetical protein